MKLTWMTSFLAIAFLGLTHCASPTPDAADEPQSLTTTYGGTVSTTEIQPNGDLRTTLTDSSGRTLATLAWSEEAGAHLEIGGTPRAIDLGPQTPTAERLNDEVRMLWMTAQEDSVPRGGVCFESDGCRTCCENSGCCTCCEGVGCACN